MRRTLRTPYYQAVRTRVPILVCTLFCVTAATQADTLLYTITGIFPSNPVTELDSNFNVIGQTNVPINSLIAPGATYQFQFSLSTTPTPTDANPTAPVAHTILTYAVNGQTMFSSPNSVAFFSADAGGFVVPEYGVTVGSDVYYWSWLGPQLFTGTADSPTLLTGTFASDGASQGSPALQFVGVNDILWELPDNSVVTVIDGGGSNAIATEPGTAAQLSIAGLLCVCAGVAKDKRCRHRHLRSVLLRTTH